MSETEFRRGLPDWKTETVFSRGLHVKVDGKLEAEGSIKDESLRKERLAGEPFKFITECGRHFSIGLNLETNQLTLKVNGDDVEKLPEVKKELKICRNKIKHSSTGDQRYVSLILIYVCRVY